MLPVSLDLETSITSYLRARLSRDLVIAAHQQITREWWDSVLCQYQVFISAAVLEEIARGDRQAAQLRLAQVTNFPLVGVVPEVVNGSFGIVVETVYFVTKLLTTQYRGASLALKCIQLDDHGSSQLRDLHFDNVPFSLHYS